MRKKVSFLTLASIISLHPQTMAKSNYGIASSMEMSVQSVESQQTNAKVFSYKALFKKNLVLAPNLTAKIHGGFNLDVGSTTSSIVDEYTPTRQFILKDAHVSWTPYSFIQLKTGAIKQDKNKELLVSEIPFLAAQEQITIKFTKNHKIYLKFLQAIPNNYFLANRIGVINDEGTPTYFTESIGAILQGDLVTIDAEFSHFNFSDLSTTAAYNSQFLGNSITGGSSLNSSYLYGFAGYIFNTKIEANISDNFGIDLNAQYLYNDKAPDNRNNGELFSAGLRIGMHHIFLGHFRNESDSSPAFYNSKRVGHNNSEGKFFGIKTYSGTHQKKKVIEYILKYTHKEPIASTLFQSPEDKVYLAIKKNFAW